MSRAGADEEGGKDASWRRFFGSLVCAALLLPWLFGIDRLPRDADDAASVALFLGICWIIAWRAWPAVEIAWEFFTSPAAKRAYAPMWPHVLGALSLGLALAFATAIPLLLAGRESDVDPGARARGSLLFALIFYIAWPAIVAPWRRLRMQNP